MKRIPALVFSALLLTASVAPVQGQAALLVLIFGDKVATENFHFGLKGGLNFANLSGIDDTGTKRGFNFGLLANIKLSERWSVVPEFAPLSQKGAKDIPYVLSGLPPVDGVINPPDESQMNLNYLDLPVVVQYRIGDRLTLGTGPAFAILLSSSNQFTRRFREEDQLVYTESSQIDWNWLDVGWSGEVRFTLIDPSQGTGVILHGRYTKGFSDIIKDNPADPITNSNFQIFVSVPFMKDPDDGS